MFGLDFIPNPLEGAPFGTVLEVCLIIAFAGWMLSLISASKYPDYGDYRATTSALVPLPPRGGWIVLPLAKPGSGRRPLTAGC